MSDVSQFIVAGFGAVLFTFVVGGIVFSSGTEQGEDQ
jgi:hypothetical protein